MVPMWQVGFYIKACATGKPMSDTPICLSCVHYQGSGISGFEYLAHTCTACPDGIPRETITGDPRLVPPNGECRYLNSN